MKATRANLLGEFTGKLDGLIYYRSRLNGKLYVRRQFSFKNHPGHPRFREVQQAIFALQPSPGYIQDLKTYLMQYNLLQIKEGQALRSWTNLYVRLMYAMQKANPESVNLATITREQIDQQDLPCKSLQAAITAGLLPAVKGYERFTANL